MHNDKDRPMTMNDRVALARHKRIKAGDIWPGDLLGFDGSVRHDASPEYVGSRGVVQQLDGRPVTIPSDRPVIIRIVDVKVRNDHPYLGICPDCGMSGQRKGHQECQYPRD